jgi:ketosteroid isomerase-like protein
METKPGELARNLFQAINTKQWEQLLAFFHDDAALIFPGTSPLSGEHRGKESVKKYFRRMNIAVPDLQFEIRAIAESDNLAMIEWRNGGKTRRGEAYGNYGVTVLQFRDGKVLELRDYLDTERLKGN